MNVFRSNITDLIDITTSGVARVAKVGGQIFLKRDPLISNLCLTFSEFLLDFLEQWSHLN